MARVMQGRAKEKEKGWFEKTIGAIPGAVVGTVGAATGNAALAAGGFGSAASSLTGMEEMKELGTIVGAVTEPEDESVDIINPTLRKYM